MSSLVCRSWPRPPEVCLLSPLCLSFSKRPFLQRARRHDGRMSCQSKSKSVNNLARVDADPPQVAFSASAAAPAAAESLSHMWLSSHKTCRSLSGLILSDECARVFAQQLELQHTEDSREIEIITPDELQTLYCIFMLVQYLYHDRSR